jgi:aspartate carbamoyltransferase catalytic subunit
LKNNWGWEVEVKKDLISIDDLRLEQILDYLDLAARVEGIPNADKAGLLPGRLLATLFFEPSTRTRLSFETAMCRLGGRVIGFSETASSSTAKGESFSDTIRTVEQYADILALRHPKEGTARLASEIAGVPIINGGDGANQHPTQTLLDLFTIRKFFGRVDGLKIALVGDLKYSRTIHSLCRALLLFDRVSMVLVSPASLRLPGYLMKAAAGTTTTFRESDNLSAAIHACDLVYMTRIQKERFPDVVDYEKVKNVYCLDAQMLAGVPENFKVLHPLPRVNEISPDVDATPYAGYFEQARNGVIMRQAIILDLLDARP